MPLGESFDTTLAAARAGADWAWRQLYEDLAPVLLGYLRQHGAVDAEDLLGEVFLQIVRRLSTFEGGEEGFRSWVFTIAHHKLIDDRRYRGRRPATPHPNEEIAPEMPHEDTVELDALDHLTAQEITELLEVLTEDQREVLLLRLAGFTIAEVAEIVDRNENATKALQRRGLRSLERRLEEIGGYPYPSADGRRSHG